MIDKVICFPWDGPTTPDQVYIVRSISTQHTITIM